MAAAPVLVHFCKKGSRGNARTIADAVIAPDPAREIALAYPVTTEIAAGEADYASAIAAFYENAAERLAEPRSAAGRDRRGALRGRSVLLRLLHASLAALAAPLPDRGRAGRHRHVGRLDARGAPITWGDDVLTVLPGTSPRRSWSAAAPTPTRP